MVGLQRSSKGGPLPLPGSPLLLLVSWGFDPPRYFETERKGLPFSGKRALLLN